MNTINLSNGITIYPKFHVKPPKGKPDLRTVFVRFQVNQKSLFMHETLVSTGFTFEKERWHNTRISHKRDEKELQKQNTKLSEYETAIDTALTVYMDNTKGMKDLHWREVAAFIERDVKPLINHQATRVTKEQKQKDSILSLIDSYFINRQGTGRYKQSFHDMHVHLCRSLKKETVFLSDLTVPVTKTYINNLYYSLKQNAASTYGRRLRTLLIYAEETGLIKKSPIPRKGLLKGFRPGRRPNLREHELLQIEALTGLTTSKERLKQLFLFMCATSLGLGDIRQLRKQHFTIEDGKRLIEKEREKTGELCRIPLSHTAVRIWDEHFNWMDLEMGMKTEFEPFAQLPSDSYCYRIFNELVKMAGLTIKVGTYTPRHSYATNYIRGKGDIHILKKIMGHTNIKTTMIYVNLQDAELSEDAEKVYANSPFHNSQNPIQNEPQLAHSTRSTCLPAN